MRRSMEEVVSYLERVDPTAAARARERYSCFDHAGADDDGQSYGFAAAFGAGVEAGAALWERELDAFRRVRARYLIYRSSGE